MLFPFQLSSCECYCLSVSGHLCPLLGLSPPLKGISTSEQEARESVVVLGALMAQQTLPATPFPLNELHLNVADQAEG